MKNFKIISVIALLVLSTGLTFAQKKSNSMVLGTWTFSAPEAPYGYNSGDIVIKKDKKELTGEIVFSEYYKFAVQDLKFEKGVLTFKAYVEGETINTKATIVKDNMKGTVVYSGGTMSITAKRKVE